MRIISVVKRCGETGRIVSSAVVGNATNIKAVTSSNCAGAVQVEPHLRQPLLQVSGRGVAFTRDCNRASSGSTSQRVYKNGTPARSPITVNSTEPLSKALSVLLSDILRAKPFEACSVYTLLDVRMA